MRKRFNSTPAAAMLSAGVALLCAFVVAASVDKREVAARGESGKSSTPLSSSGRLVLEQCRENVMIIHDVYWAAACTTNAPPDDSPECTLPDERASVLNAARSDAENLCMDEAAAADRAMANSASTR